MLQCAVLVQGLWAESVESLGRFFHVLARADCANSLTLRAPLLPHTPRTTEPRKPKCPLAPYADGRTEIPHQALPAVRR